MLSALRFMMPRDLIVSALPESLSFLLTEGVTELVLQPSILELSSASIRNLPSSSNAQTPTRSTPPLQEEYSYSSVSWYSWGWITSFFSSVQPYDAYYSGRVVAGIENLVKVLQPGTLTLLDTYILLEPWKSADIRGYQHPQMECGYPWTIFCSLWSDGNSC